MGDSQRGKYHVEHVRRQAYAEVGCIVRGMKGQRSHRPLSTKLEFWGDGSWTMDYGVNYDNEEEMVNYGEYGDLVKLGPKTKDTKLRLGLSVEAEGHHGGSDVSGSRHRSFMHDACPAIDGIGKDRNKLLAGEEVERCFDVDAYFDVFWKALEAHFQSDGYERVHGLRALSDWHMIANSVGAKGFLSAELEFNWMKEDEFLIIGCDSHELLNALFKVAENRSTGAGDHVEYAYTDSSIDGGVYF
ncbi:hypothetical protein SUGI_0429960 [Cryptomeria japonica]|nr:hypothetical protein SUGI_0429960 [Cryptomeria japonica]